MFYSHEVLTSRKYGVATVWLVATLGSQSTMKKVNRKAILDVDVPKACETIITPEVPMALRLQSNLLYGVSRVYSQQCGYILSDAQNTQNNMRALLKIIKNMALDPEAGRTRPGQLTLEDDPAFVPDLPLLPLDASFSNLAMSSASSSQYSSMLSPHTARSSFSSQSADGSVLGLIIPTSNTDGDAGDIGGFVLPGDDGRAPGSRASKTGISAAIYEDPEDGFFPDVDFEFDGDGNIRDFGAERRAAQTSEPAGTRRSLDSDSQASGRVRMDHDAELMAGAEIGDAVQAEFDLPMDDEFGILPDADPFPDMTALAMEAPNILDDSFTSKEATRGDESSESTEAPVHRRKKALKLIPRDAGTTLRNTDLGQWNREYVSNMAEATKKKSLYRAAPQAKRNAALWVFGNGIGGIGLGIGLSKINNTALENFSGQKLLASFSTRLAKQISKKRSNANDEGDPASDSDGRRVRSRQGDEDQISRGVDMMLEEDGMIPVFDNDGIEIGREAPPALPEFSSAMPWNTGSRAGSATGRFYSSSMGGFPTSATGPEGSVPGSLPRRINRLTSASPLVGRGPRPSSGLERLSSLDIPDDEAALLGRGSDDTGPELGVDEFELYGPSAAVDTQTAQQTQWVRDALDRESYNFLDFVKAAIEGQDPPDDGLSGAGRLLGGKFVIFEELLPPSENTKMVAAQGLIHTLSLATKNLITVQQDEPYGSILMSIL